MATAAATLILDPILDSTLRIPFKSAEHADIARRVILVDRELNGHLVERSILVDGNNLVAYVARPSVVSLVR